MRAEPEAGAAREPLELRARRAAASVATTAMQLPAGARRLAPGPAARGRRARRRRAGRAREPKFASTSTPTVALGSDATRLAVPMPALPAEADHARAGADRALRDRPAAAAASARPASSASTCTTRAVGEPAVVALPDDRDHDLVGPTAGSAATAAATAPS